MPGDPINLITKNGPLSGLIDQSHQFSVFSSGEGFHERVYTASIRQLSKFRLLRLFSRPGWPLGCKRALGVVPTTGAPQAGVPQAGANTSDLGLATNFVYADLNVLY